MDLNNILILLQSVDKKLSAMMISGDAVLLMADARRILNNIYMDIGREVHNNGNKNETETVVPTESSQ